MKFIIPKQQFYGDFSTIQSIRLASNFSILRLPIVFLLFFFSILSLSFTTLAIEKNSQQVPAKKTIKTSAKRVSSSKILKGKKGSKNKKSVVVKKDTLVDIDPASTNSPLFNQ
jgi:hypothetical protein